MAVVVQAVKRGATETDAQIGAGLRSEQSPGTRPTLCDGVAWRDAAVAWLLTRLILSLLTYLVLMRRLPRPAGTPYPTMSEWLHVWSNWDGGLYAILAESGYTHLQQAAFFPLYPLLERILQPLTGGEPALAGLLIANVACLIAFALFRVLAEREYGRAVARRALLYLAIFPYSFFLAAAYAEALFLVLSLAAFLALREHHWKWAGLFAALATLTRPVGILLLVPLIYEYSISNLSRAQGRRLRLRGEVFALLLPILALVGFNLALAPRFGTLSSTTMAERSGWGRTLSWPWEGILRAGSVLVHAPLGFTTLHAGLDIVWTLVFVVLAVASIWPIGRWSRNRLPLSYALYALATVTLVLLTPMHKPGFDWASLASNGRFLLVVFPLFLFLGRLGVNHRWLNRLIVTLSLIFFVLLSLAFISGAFVA